MMAQLTEEDSSQLPFASLQDAEQKCDLSGAADAQIFEASGLAVASATVYLDRAEVCRVLRPRLPAGESEVIIKSLTPAIDKDSIRVEVKGPATIADVSYSARHNRADAESKTEKRAAAQAVLRAEQRSLESLRCRQARLCKQRDVLNSFAEMLIRKPATEPLTEAIGLNSLVEAFNPRHMDSLNSFFDLYGRQAGRLDYELIEVRVQIQLKEEAIVEMEAQLKTIEANYSELLSREVSIVLDSQEAAQVELGFSYVVSRAKWSPKYDIRVFSNESAMKIIYYGLVQQTTGEDWNSCQLSLSTSRPGIGGAPPPIGVQRAHFRITGVGSGRASDSAVASVALRKSASKLRKSRGVGKTLSFHAPNDKSLVRAGSEDGGARDPASLDEATAGRSLEEEGKPAGVSEPAVNGFDEGGEFRPGFATLSVRSPPAPAASNVQSALFNAPRLISIPSNGADHKVTIAIIDLCPTFEYVSVPQKAPYAFLKANVTNTSCYPLLAGPTSVYVDNNFVTKSELKSAAPQEEFSCSLGADHGIRIAYKPMFKKKETGQSAKVATYLHKQVIELRNTHRKAVRVLVMEVLPVTLEDKIKVSLQEPVIKHPEKYDRQKATRLNKANNVEWDVDLEPGEAKEVILRYSIECPAGECLDFTVCEA